MKKMEKKVYFKKRTSPQPLVCPSVKPTMEKSGVGTYV